jgi:hypothetical protein
MLFLQKYLLLFGSVAVAFIATSCTEKIDLKLKDSSPKIIIEGRVTDEAGPYYVAVSNSSAFTEKTFFEGIDSATVIISDDAGKIDTLTKVYPGIFITNTLQGVVGRSYFLNVITGGKTYSSVSTMAPPVDIDSIGFEKSIGFNNRESLSADCFFRDPIGVRNYYKVEATRNGKKQTSNDVSTDRLWDGKYRNLFIPNDTLVTGDTLEVSLLQLDEKVFNYFDALEDISGGFNQPAAPANPPTNIVPQTLGYFSAHSIKKKTVIVP